MAAACPARYLNGHMSLSLKNELRAIVLNPQTNVPFVVEEEEQAVSGANS